MRKTKLFIFTLALMLTLLLGVACDSAPVSVPEENGIPFGCVQAYVSFGNGRSLTSTPSVPNEITNWDYKLEPLWKYSDTVTETIHGSTDWSPLPDNGSIGWVTPGLWKVSVYGSHIMEGGRFATLYYGETEVYFSNNNSSATVFIKPFENKSYGNVNFDIRQPYLSETNDEYYYVYSIKGLSGDKAYHREGLLEKGEVVGGFIPYTCKIEKLKADYYNISVMIYRNEKNLTDLSIIKSGSVIGGQVLGEFIQDMATVNVSGTLDPSDFVEGRLNVSSLTVSGEMTPSENIAINNAATFTVTDKTSSSKKSDYNISYRWYVNGVEQTSGIAYGTNSNGETTTTLTHSFTKYGPKEVSCVIAYQLKSDTSKVYTSTVRESFTINP